MPYLSKYDVVTANVALKFYVYHLINYISLES